MVRAALQGSLGSTMDAGAWRPQSKPPLGIVSGASASEKTTLSRLLADRLPLPARVQSRQVAVVGAVLSMDGGSSVGLLDALKGMLGFGSSNGSVDRGVYLYVQCNRCQDVVRVRINMSSEVSEISSEPEDDEDLGGMASGNAKYVVSKGVVDSKCFRPMKLRILFDGRRRQVDQAVDGGTVVDQAAWDAVRAARQDSSGSQPPI